MKPLVQTLIKVASDSRIHRTTGLVTITRVMRRPPITLMKVADHESASTQARGCHDGNICLCREGALTGQPGIVKCERVIEGVRGKRNATD